MNTKLTLSLDKKVIERAKDYAKRNDISLSFLIENYLLKLVTESTPNKTAKGSIVEELSGIIDLRPDADYKEEYFEYLSKKYE